MVDLVVDKGPCGFSLKQHAFIISIFCLGATILSIIIVSLLSLYTRVLAGFSFLSFGSICLLLGAFYDNYVLVFVWLINAILYFIYWTVAFFGVLFNYGKFHKIAFFDNVYIIVAEYTIELLVVLFMTRLVYSFFVQLRNAEDNPE